MACAVNEHIAICRPTLDGWWRFFARCPVCKTKRLCLAEFQDYYGARCTCLTCGTGWMDNEYRTVGKRERPRVIAGAKERIQQYVAADIPQGLAAYMKRLETELAK